jgi:hypothetical protein
MFPKYSIMLLIIDVFWLLQVLMLTVCIQINRDIDCIDAIAQYIPRVNDVLGV